jgi:hypothetical protein
MKKTGYGLKVKTHDEPWGFLFQTYDAAERRKFTDRDYRPDELVIVRMTWTWENVEPVEPVEPNKEVSRE